MNLMINMRKILAFIIVAFPSLSYAAWEVKGGVMTGVKPIRYEFPVRHPLTFHLVDKFSKKKFKQSLCVKAEFFRVKD